MPRPARPISSCSISACPTATARRCCARSGKFSQTPVIILSARDREAEKIEALDLGADDYVEKPFGIGELTARLRAALRHAASEAQQPPRIEIDGVAMDFDRRLVTRDGVADQADAQGIRSPGDPLPQCRPRRHPSPDSVRGLGAGPYRGHAISARVHRAAARQDRTRPDDAEDRHDRAGRRLPRCRGLRRRGVPNARTTDHFSAPRHAEFGADARNLPKHRWHARCESTFRLLGGQAVTALLKGAHSTRSSMSLTKRILSRAAGALVGGALALAAVAAWAERHDQDRHSALALRHDGDQRDDAERRHADADRRAEQEGRRARQEARGGRRRPRLQLAAVRRKGEGADREGQGLGRVRLLDLGVAQVRAAGVQGARLDPLLSRAVRGRGIASATSSTPAPRPTSRRFPPSTI